MKRFAVVALIFASVALVVTIGGALAFGLFTRAQAARGSDNPIANVVREVVGEEITINHRGPGDPELPGFGLPLGRFADQEALAEALGITTDELQTAQEAARAKALEQALEEAVANGDLTQKQADAIREGSASGERFSFGFIPGRLGLVEAVDYQVLLAEELGITTDALTAAIDEAKAAAIAQALEDGAITQEQADWILAQDELRTYIDPQAILAKALGVTTDDLQASLDEGKSLYEIVQELGLSATDVSDARYQAYKDALAQAVSDEVITQAQADQLLLNNMGGGRGMRGGKGFDGGFGERFDRRGGMPFGLPFGEPSTDQ
jgi:hypothetical protein